MYDLLTISVSFFSDSVHFSSIFHFQMPSSATIKQHDISIARISKYRIEGIIGSSVMKSSRSGKMGKNSIIVRRSFQVFHEKRNTQTENIVDIFTI